MSDQKAQAIQRTMTSLPTAVRDRIQEIDISGVRLTVTWKGPFAQSEADMVARAWRELCTPVVCHTWQGAPGASPARVEQQSLPLGVHD